MITYMTGMVTAFFMTQMFVFTQTSHIIRRSAFYFSLVNVVAVSQTWAISMVLANYALPSIGVSRFVPEIAHAVGVVFPVFTSYLGHKHWSFR